MGRMHRERAKRFVVVDEREAYRTKKINALYACSLGEKRFLSQNFSLMLRACQVPLFFFGTKLPLAGLVLSSRILGQKTNKIVAQKLKWNQ